MQLPIQIPTIFPFSAKGKKDAARKWLLNVKYDGQLCVHSQQIALQVMGDYTLRNPRRLKKVDKTHIQNILGGAGNSEILPGPPSKRCKQNSQSNDSGSSDFTTTMQNEEQNYQKNQLIKTLIRLQISEWKGLSMDNLQYELEKIKRLKPIVPGSGSI